MICPKCECKLIQKDRSFTCENRHNYDIAKQGYVNLMLSKCTTSGDSKEMVLARHQFLNKGYYQKLKATCERLVRYYHPEVLVDLGCGEGYYTSALSKYASISYGIDLSKEALKIASREDKKTQYILASIFHLPIEKQTADMITNIFAPTPLDEVKRILKKDGIYVRVTPHMKHLHEFKQALYEEVYDNEVETIEDENLTLIEEIQVDDFISLQTSEDIEALFMMTPYYWKSSKRTSDIVHELKKLDTSISFEIQVYKNHQ